jgi:hypothetical protein
MAEHTVLHAYGLVPAAIDALALPPGIDGCSVSAVTVGPFAVLASTLSAQRYGRDAWTEHADDLSWVKQLVSEHHRVLQQAVEQTDVLPLSLSTIHLDEDSLRRGILVQQNSLQAALDRVRGHIEMGVKVYAAPAPEDSNRAPGPATGREYLTRRSAQQRDVVGRWERLQLASLRVHEELAQRSTHARANPAQDPVLSGRADPMLLNGAYLVPRADETAFRLRAAEVAAEVTPEGVFVECTGPWPAYNFADDATLVGASS